jgi:hypothetical protein
VPLVIRDDDHRERYLDALETADRGDLGPLVSLFANVVSADLNDAITFVRTMHGRDIKAIAAAASEAARRRVAPDETALIGLTDHYAQLAYTRLTSVAEDLDNAFAGVVQDLPGGVAPTYAEAFDGGPNLTWRQEPRSWSRQVLHAASEYGYSVDLGRYRRDIALQLPDTGLNTERWYIAVSFHHSASRGRAMAAVLFLTVVDQSTSEFLIHQTVILGSNQEFSYTGRYQQDDRFRAWLDAGLLKVLEAWQARI